MLTSRSQSIVPILRIMSRQSPTKRSITISQLPLVGAVLRSFQFCFRKIYPWFCVAARWVKRILPFIIALLLIWVIGGNLLASFLERGMYREVDAYLEQYPRQEPNDSALKLYEYMAQLGIGQGMIGTAFDTYGRYLDEQPAFNMSTSRQTDVPLSTFDTFGEYMNILSESPGVDFPEIPDLVKEYLNERAIPIDAISQHLNTHELPELGSDFEYYLGNLDLPIPSYLSFSNLSRILLVDSIAKYQDGRYQEAFLPLNAHLKIYESLQKNHSLISQLVSIILGRIHVSVFDRAVNLAEELNDVLPYLDHHASILETIKYEYVTISIAANNSSILSNFLEIFIVMEPINAPVPSGNFDHLFLKLKNLFSSFWSQGFEFLATPILRPYTRLAGINMFYLQQEAYPKLLLEPYCSVSEFPVSIPWWNVLAKVSLPSYMGQSARGTELMLRHELLRRLWEVETSASETGNWPDSLSQPESSVCPGRQWNYTVQGNEMSISFSQTFDWIQSRIESGNALPLEYHRVLDPA